MADCEPEAVLRVLQNLHRLVGKVVSHHGATLGLFASDRVLMFVGDPVPGRSIDRLVDEVWDNDPPDSALAALRVHVSRKMLAAAGLENLLVTRPRRARNGRRHFAASWMRSWAWNPRRTWRACTRRCLRNPLA